MGGVGDRLPAGPDPGVGGDQAPVECGPDPVQVGGHVDHPADHGRVDGVVAGIDADVVVAAQPDPVDQPSCGGTGGSGSIAARSASIRSTGRALIVRTIRPFARSSQSANWALKSAGDAKLRPGMNEVSKNPLRRSTMPLDSGS